MDGVMHMLGDSSITNKQSNSTWAPQSPTYSIKTHYHSSSSHSNSKESLWAASTQSSPNNAHREQLQQPNSSSSSPSSSLWENPSSKLSQASLMSKNDSLSSIWQTPPQTQSPVNKVGNLWDSLTSYSSTSLFGANTDSSNASSSNSYLSLHNSGHSLIRPQDISSADIWSNNNASVISQTKTKDPVGSLWANPTMSTPYTKVNTMATSTPVKPNHINPIKPERSVYNNPPNQMASSKYSISSSAVTSAPASSSCLQLFSDEFINYLNMIN